MYEFLSLSFGSRGDWLKSISVNCIDLFDSFIWNSLKLVAGWASKIDIVMRNIGTYFRCIIHSFLGCFVEKRGGKRGKYVVLLKFGVFYMDVVTWSNDCVESYVVVGFICDTKTCDVGPITSCDATDTSEEEYPEHHTDESTSCVGFVEFCKNTGESSKSNIFIIPIDPTDRGRRHAKNVYSPDTSEVSICPFGGVFKGL